MTNNLDKSHYSSASLSTDVLAEVNEAVPNQCLCNGKNRTQTHPHIPLRPSG